MIDSSRIAALSRDLYDAILTRCAPDAVLREAVETGRIVLPDDPAAIVALGKCAVPLATAAVEVTGLACGIAAHPTGYEGNAGLPAGVERVEGGHPLPTEESLAAAKRVTDIAVGARGPVLFLLSGGSSACVEENLEPHVSFTEVVEINAQLIRSGLPIESINTVRRHVSAVKGGRLGVRAPRGSVTLVHSDVPPGRADLVGSGPTALDPTTLSDAVDILSMLGTDLASSIARRLASGNVPETPKESPMPIEVLADSDLLVTTAMDECRARGLRARRGPTLDGSIEAVARNLKDAYRTIGEGDVLVSAGEATVEVRDARGIGGRCVELASRFVLECENHGFFDSCGLFATSDGKDGSSPAAAVVVLPSTKRRLDRDLASEALERSSSYQLVTSFGEAIIMKPTGNNLRDIVLLYGMKQDHGPRLWK